MPDVYTAWVDPSDRGEFQNLLNSQRDTWKITKDNTPFQPTISGENIVLFYTSNETLAAAAFSVNNQSDRNDPIEFQVRNPVPLNYSTQRLWDFLGWSPQNSLEYVPNFRIQRLADNIEINEEFSLDPFVEALDFILSAPNGSGGENRGNGGGDGGGGSPGDGNDGGGQGNEIVALREAARTTFQFPVIFLGITAAGLSFLKDATTSLSINTQMMVGGSILLLALVSSAIVLGVTATQTDGDKTLITRVNFLIWLSIVLNVLGAFLLVWGMYIQIPT